LIDVDNGIVTPMGDVLFRRDGGPPAAAVGADLLRMYAEVYAEPPYLEGPPQVARFARQLPALLAADGFQLARATTVAGELVGAAYGVTFAAGRWFPDSSPPPSDILHSPLFVVMDWMVRRPWRGRGVGRELLAQVLDGRSEPWAVLMTNPAARARDIYLGHGWRMVGTSTPPLFPRMEILAMPLRGDRTAR
jgi:GNAT superfamily N-acetyltransferase